MPLSHPTRRGHFSLLYSLLYYNTTLYSNTTRGIMLITGMNKISTKLGQNLKKIRTQKKMSQGDIARNLGVDRGYISNIENGKKNPTLATVDKLAKALGVPADELLK